MNENTGNIKTTHRDMQLDGFKKYAEQALAWIITYFENMRDYPVLSTKTPNEVKAQLPPSPPEQAEDFAQILKDFESIIIPGITHWNHPRFFAYFSITGSLPGIIGELLSAALNVNAMLWKTSPSATELEEMVLDWLRQMLGLPEKFEGVINDTASSSSMYAMAAARESTGLNIRESGMAGRENLPLLRMYTSEEAHSSVEKAAIVLGIGQENCIKIPTDEAFRMDVTALKQQLESDINAGYKPICVIATIGTTSTTSVDPIQEIADICQKHGIWLHVDAAYGGSAAVLPENRKLFEGWERADSIVMNPHKWLATQIDCSVLFCRKQDTLRQAFSLVPEYLRTAEEDEVKNLMDYGTSLGRRFRSLKLWFVIRAFGTEQIREAIREHISFSQRLAELIDTQDDFELLAPVPFSTLVFRYAPKDAETSEIELNALNESLLHKINSSGEVYLSHTKVRGKYGIRLAIGNFKTTWEDIMLAWEIVQKEAAGL